jgi:DNA (cytosine-5)-methyltransferase 1
MIEAPFITPTNNTGPFRFIDLFAGIDGLRRGFDAIGGKCIFTCEWNPYAQKTYLANYHDGVR